LGKRIEDGRKRLEMGRWSVEGGLGLDRSMHLGNRRFLDIDTYYYYYYYY
jgi:hypothetical protein